MTAVPVPLDEFRPWRAKRFAYDGRDSGDSGLCADYLADAALYRRTQPTTFDGKPVNTTMRWFVGSRAAFLHSVSRNGGTTGRSREDDAADSMDGILVCLVTAGRFTVETNGCLLQLSEGDLFLMDSGVPHVMHDHPGSIVVLFLPRIQLAATLGTAGTTDLAGRLLTGVELASLLELQLRWLAQNLGAIRPVAFDGGLTHCANLALTIVEGRTDERGAAKSNLVARAKALVAASSGDPALDPQRISMMLGVSRTKLYAAFAGQGLTVAAYLRERRLQTFMALLTREPDRPIQELAFVSGFGGDPSDFTKTFRASYGITPSEARAALFGE